MPVNARSIGLWVNRWYYARFCRSRNFEAKLLVCRIKTESSAVRRINVTMTGLSTLFRTTLLALTLLSSSLAVAAAYSATVAVKDIRLGVTAERTRLVQIGRAHV